MSSVTLRTAREFLRAMSRIIFYSTLATEYNLFLVNQQIQLTLDESVLNIEDFVITSAVSFRISTDKRK